MFSPESIYIFEGLSLQEVSYFLLMAETKRFKKDDVIICEGDESNDKAYCLKEGSVNVYRGTDKIATLEAGDIFGELALITNEPRTATVTAADEIEVLMFNKDDFLMLYRKSDRYEEIKQKILSRIKDNFYGNKK
jgi:CRP-like cAMP-binding protein